MKTTDIENPVHREWLQQQGLRLDPGPYISGAMPVRMIIEKSPTTEPLKHLTSGHNGGIFNGPKFRRVYMDSSENGTPFLGSTDMLESDFTYLPWIRKIDANSTKLSYLKLEGQTTLISCSGSVGRTSYTRSDMACILSSQDILKVCADADLIPPGYLHAYLASPAYGNILLKSSAYGAIIQHIEPHHIADLPVPRLGSHVEDEIHSLIQKAADLRTEYQRKLVTATEDFFLSAGLPELVDPQWHQQGRDLGHHVNRSELLTLRALNYGTRAQHILAKLGSVPHRTLGEICRDGQLSRGKRFKRVDSDPDHGIRLLGQRQAFWLRPEGRWVTLNSNERADVTVRDETVLVAAQGTLGENEVYGRSLLATGSWLEHAYSEHFLRVVSGDPEFPGAYLFAFLRSHTAFRLMRSFSTGGKQQDLHPVLRARLPVPETTPTSRERISETVREAFRDRDNADIAEDLAFEKLDEAIQEAVR